MAYQQAGWYQDPEGNPSRLRYWDGMQWTNDYADAQQAQPQFVVQQTYQETYYSDQSGAQARSEQVYYAQSTLSSTDQNLRLAAFIFCIFSLVTLGWMLIPLAWIIPMTIHCWGIYKGTKLNSTGFGVCTLIFLNFVAGILLLISKKD